MMRKAWMSQSLGLEALGNYRTQDETIERSRAKTKTGPTVWRLSSGGAMMAEKGCEIFETFILHHFLQIGPFTDHGFH